MGFSKAYDPAEFEPQLQAEWEDLQRYAFDPTDPRPIFVIDTPPPTVSGDIHIGHVYSYVQAEAIVRFRRMQGFNVLYPFGFDDNGLPTERFVERRSGLRAQDLGRDAFVAACLEASHEVEARFEQFWKRLGFSVDWRYRYSTIAPHARRIAQWSFLDLLRRGLAYRAQAPHPWCYECGTAVAQAEMEDISRTTTFYYLRFSIATEPEELLIATTRPELLPACVAIFVHPDDPRFQAWIGREAVVPLSQRHVPILADEAVEPQKGSGAVMCCTFGDTTDVHWWRTHALELIALIDRQGRLSAAGGTYAGLRLAEARTRIVNDLRMSGHLHNEQQAEQSVRIHERCGKPIEILESQQWYIKVLSERDALLEAGRQIEWHPEFMRTRYEHWVQNLNWDWCISRQRFFGVAFPVWHCADCGAIIPATEAQLPIDPRNTDPPQACACGSSNLLPDTDVMDTWATSSLTPLIVQQMLPDAASRERAFPLQLRPHAHDIIRTWSFYTIVQSHYHFNTIPWQTLMISGHALDPSGRKFSKSKQNAAIAPEVLITRYGADALRYWACRAGLGHDQPLNESQLRQGRRLMNKLWNAAKLLDRCDDSRLETAPAAVLDRALHSWLQDLVDAATARWEAYDYAGALALTERFFWGTYCDLYLELIKGRLYDGSKQDQATVAASAGSALITILQLLAPVLPHVCEAIYQRLTADGRAGGSIHTTDWPRPEPRHKDARAERAGHALTVLTGAVRRYKTERGLSLAAPLELLRISTADCELRDDLQSAEYDIRSMARTSRLDWPERPTADAEEMQPGLWLELVQ
jgi:valyl-tRNA synthetase